MAWAYVWRGALALAVILAAAGLARRLGTATALRLALVAGAHQVAIALAIFLRASWLAAAIDILSREKGENFVDWDEPPKAKD